MFTSIAGIFTGFRGAMYAAAVSFFVIVCAYFGARYYSAVKTIQRLEVDLRKIEEQSEVFRVERDMAISQIEKIRRSLDEARAAAENAEKRANDAAYAASRRYRSVPKRPEDVRDANETIRWILRGSSPSGT